MHANEVNRLNSFLPKIFQKLTNTWISKGSENYTDNINNWFIYNLKDVRSFTIQQWNKNSCKFCISRIIIF